MVGRWFNVVDARPANPNTRACMRSNCHTWIMHSFGKNGLEGSTRMADAITGNGPIRIKIEDDKSNWKKTDEADKADRAVVWPTLNS